LNYMNGGAAVRFVSHMPAGKMSIGQMFQDTREIPLINMLLVVC